MSKTEKDCIFCKIIKGEIPCSKIHENKDFLAFLDIRPINKGHTLVIPKHHCKNILDFPKAEEHLRGVATVMATEGRELTPDSVLTEAWRLAGSAADLRDSLAEDGRLRVESSAFYELLQRSGVVLDGYKGLEGSDDPRTQGMTLMLLRRSRLPLPLRRSALTWPTRRLWNRVC